MLTPEEFEVLEHLRMASISFFDLPEHHPHDKEEWAHEIHALQHRVMRRSAVREYPSYFTPFTSKED